MIMRCVTFQRYLVALAWVVFLVADSAAESPARELPGIRNFFRVTTNVFSGSQPEGAAAFAALSGLGVKTLVSVDGAKPDVELAAKHGLRYVHLPIGYDGIPTNRVAELAKAAMCLPGPVYVHCHHGRHRGPAAVSVMCLAEEGWTPAQAEAFMHQAGTGAEYPGLYRAVREFKPPTAQQLAGVSTNFAAVAKTSSLVGTMVMVDIIYDRLKRVQKAGWKVPADHSDIAPAHEAMMLLEQLRELARSEDTVRRPADYRVRLDGAIRATEALRSQLSVNAASPDAAFTRVSRSCADCHRRYRNE